MEKRPSQAIRNVLPGLAWALTLALHFFYAGHWTKERRLQQRWAATTPETPYSLMQYWREGEVWSGLAYAASAALLLWLVINRAAFRAQSPGKSRWLLGGAGLGGAVAASSCFLAGCCGSPILALYAGFFGAATAGRMRPVMSIVSMLLTGLSWWLLRRYVRSNDAAANCDCPANC